MEGVDKTGMIGILEYSIVTGNNIRTVDEIAGFCNAETRQQMRDIGLSTVPTDNCRALSHMLDEACGRIQQQPDCILVAHSLPFIRKNGCDYLNFLSAPVFFLSGLPCVIMHKAVEIGCKLIQAHLYEKVLVVGADKAYSDNERVFFGTIMGDAVVAVLLGKDAPSHEILASEIATTIIAADGENSTDENIKRFRSVNVSLMRSAIERCWKKAGYPHTNHFVTHTSNRKFWDCVATLMKCPREMFFDDNIINTGHLNSHDSFLHYFHFWEQGIIHKGEISMLINPGFGGSQGCTLIRT